MNIDHCYKTLQTKKSASNEEISISYKRLALHYHPDKNRDNVEWATEAMKNLNIAYNTIMSHRFSTRTSAEIEKADVPKMRKTKTAQKRDVKKDVRKDEENSQVLINQFIRIRESAKDALYRYFQFSLYNIPRRENVFNRGAFNEIVFILRKSYHKIQNLSRKTDDGDLIRHFSVFNVMIYNFYKASECINIIDSYNVQYEVNAFRIFRQGDEALHIAHKEIFYDRHNRGYFKGNYIIPLIQESEGLFRYVIDRYSSSSWVVESSIKHDYIISLKEYLNLFFTEDE